MQPKFSQLSAVSKWKINDVEMGAAKSDVAHALPW
jgi:hypothetical protein